MKNTLKILFALSLSTLALPAVVYAQNGMKQTEMKQGTMMQEQLTFKSLHAPTQGRVSFQKNPDGTSTLMIKGLKTEAAPDLKVWLYKKAVQDAADIKKASGQYVVVGGLKTFSGNFSFKLPKSVKPDDFQSVVLWCDLVSTAFGVANLR
ncbi:DM13 domain-containing protein [Deinococcus cellulosilyticus]|uniref:DM13 domain-containing protein n=1 Tax=Deinococcus cellulosilyticus (strain DSM 18568 / NBRC 106333 / KACC 11606 / 5516J-15) TaxID=1223518 RepID=A0A511N7X2_DEIC1|nr:DM13 domain-containing protein [Deinococcus cellulosilyticus]GEM48942.1 hypothetical protein DC3_45770 [Deinococcus cellulosilyticus NBRC 106333 = KACC 11606]